MDDALLQQIKAFMQQPVAARQAEGTRPPSSHRQSQRRGLLHYRPECVWGTVYVCCCCSLLRCTNISVCVYVPASLCLRPMRHTRAGTCICITNVCLPAGCPCIGCVCVFLCLSACLISPKAVYRLCVTDNDPCFSLSERDTAAHLKQADEQKKKHDEQKAAAAAGAGAAPQPAPRGAAVSLRTRIKHAALQEEIRAAWARKAAAQQLWVCRVCYESITVAKQSGSALLPQCVHMICGRCAQTQRRNLHCSLCDKGTANAAIHGPHLAADALGPMDGKQTSAASAAAAAAVRECGDCRVHDESVAAMFECGQCKKDYCEAHAKAHGQMRKYAAHTLTAVPGAGVVLCGAHGHMADAYCHSCETSVCNVCMAANGPHPVPAHRITVPDEAYKDKTRARVVAAMAEAAKAMADVAKYGADARLTLEDLARRDASLTANINSTFAAVHATVETRKRTVLADLQKRSEAEAKAVGDLDAEQYARWVRLQSVSAACTQVFTTPPAALAPRAGLAMAQLETRALEGLHTLTAEAAAPGLAVPLLAPLSFRLGVSREAEEALYAALQQMGQLVLDPAAAAVEAAAQRAREEHEAKDEERRKKAQPPPVIHPKPAARK
jgi:hypothetical protein